MTGYELIASFLEDTADWRERKSAEFPSDERNLKAQTELLNLVRDANSRTDSDTARRFAALGDGAVESDVTEVVSETLRQIGFSSGYENVDDLLERILANVSIYGQDDEEAA